MPILTKRIATTTSITNPTARMRVSRPKMSSTAPTVSSSATTQPKNVGSGTPICFKKPPKPAGPFIGPLGLSLGQPWAIMTIPSARRRITRPQSLYGAKILSNMVPPRLLLRIGGLGQHDTALGRIMYQDALLCLLRRTACLLHACYDMLQFGRVRQHNRKVPHPECIGWGRWRAFAHPGIKGDGVDLFAIDGDIADAKVGHQAHDLEAEHVMVKAH